MQNDALMHREGLKGLGLNLVLPPSRLNILDWYMFGFKLYTIKKTKSTVYNNLNLIF